MTRLFKFDKPQPIIQGVTHDRFILMEDFYYQDEEYELNLIIKKGFIYDGASIPRLFWRLVGGKFMPKFQRGAVLHDELYNKNLLPRKICDKIFRKILIEDGCSKALANTMYSALRVGGGRAYRKHGKKLS
jgi:hypothetical protein